MTSLGLVFVVAVIFGHSFCCLADPHHLHDGEESIIVPGQEELPAHKPTPPIEPPTEFTPPPDDLPPPEFKAPTPEAVEALRVLGGLAGTDNSAASKCDTPFGTKLGTTRGGVVAYSNCNDQHTSNVDHIVTHQAPAGDPITRREVHDALPEDLKRIGAQQVNTGMKFQCVEFARRYLLVNHNVVFPQVMGAVDLWRYTSLQHPFNERERTHMGRYSNYGDLTDKFPWVGSLVIWPMQEEMPYGHVAVIVDVMDEPEEQKGKSKPAKGEEDPADEFKPESQKKKGAAAEVPEMAGRRLAARLRIAEQNFNSSSWEGRNYARELFLMEEGEGELKTYGIYDPEGFKTLGWMTPEPDIKPLGTLMHLDFDDDLNGALPRAVDENFQPPHDYEGYGKKVSG